MYRAVVEAATGRRELSEEELARICEHLAHAGFDPEYRIPVDGRLEGTFDLEGNPLRVGATLPSSDYHYLLHVRRRREWPEGTTPEGYEQSIRAVITNPATGIAVSWYRDEGWQLAFLRKSRELEGPRGREWVLAEYNLDHDHRATAFQVWQGRAYLEGDPDREDLLWLREPG